MTDFSFPPPQNPVPSADSHIQLPAPLQPTFDPNLFPSRHRPWSQWFADHNPCLLLSTVCMLLGCYLVNSALRAQAGDSRFLMLIGVINLYEACIIPLGLLLIRRTRGTARDGWWLLLFETLFLVNATFINPDFSTPWAIPLNIALFVLACVKAAVILHYLKIGLSPRTLGFFALQLAILYAVPIICYLTQRDGVVSPKLIYLLWWMVGLLPLVYDILVCTDRPRQWDLVQNVIRRVYVIAPWVMLLAHLGFSHWAHHSDYQLADAGPPLLGLAIASRRLNLQKTSLVRMIPAMAFLLTLFSSTQALQWHLSIAGDAHTILPAHFAIAATILTYGYMASTFQFLCSALAVVIIAASYLFQSRILAALRATIRFLLNLLPDTLISWGITTILLAFALFGAGALISLKRTRPQPAA